MATINLGNLTFTHKGDYAGGTAYVKNDVVYYATNGNSYIAKTSTTGNAPTSTAHWDLFVTGSGGIWNAGLSLGSAGQVVKVNSGGNALEFGTLASDVVKVGSGTFSGNSSAIEIDGYFSSDYRIYKLFISNLRPHNNSVNPRWRIRTGGSTYSSTQYRHFHDHWYGSNTSPAENIHTSPSYPDDFFHLAGTNSVGNTVNDGTPTSCEMTIFDPLTTTEGKTFLWQSHTHESGSGHSAQLNGWHGVGSVNTTTAMSGVAIFFNNGNVKTMNWQLYGFKH